MKHAFTLIELLVVVTIIVILIALLLPAMDKAITATEVARCGSNLHAVGIGLSLRLLDHKQQYPTTPYFGMLFGGPGLTGYQGVNYDVTVRPLNVYLGYTSNGSSVPVAKCPSDKGDPLVASTNAFRDWGNSYIEATWRDWYRVKKVFGGLTYDPLPLVSPGNPNSIRLSSLPRTDNKVIITDWPIFGDRSYDNPSARWHTDGTGEFDRKFMTLFADNHVSLFTYPRSQMEYPDGSTYAADPAFLWY